MSGIKVMLLTGYLCCSPVFQFFMIQFVQAKVSTKVHHGTTLKDMFHEKVQRKDLLKWICSGVHEACHHGAIVNSLN
jgi:hypothetical protein